MNEFELIDRYFAPLITAAPPLPRILDDAAPLVCQKDHILLTSTDAHIQTVHFLEDLSPDKVAQRALRCAFSDLAAMGASPYAYLLAVQFPASLSEEWLAAFSQGLKEEQENLHVLLLGGNTSRTPGPLSITLTVFGYGREEHILYRHQAQKGDRLYVSGNIGDSALGYLVAQHQAFPFLEESEKQYLLKAYEQPSPPLELGRALAGHAHAAIDISDGLLSEAAHVARASFLKALIKLDHIPLSAVAKKIFAATPLQEHHALWTTLLAGGGDYQLLFTLPISEVSWLESFSAHFPLPLTHIGHLGTPEREGCVMTSPASSVNTEWVHVIDANGRIIDFKQTGYSHEF